MTERNYYAIIPSNVRYDSRLCPSAKLMYGEITALSNEKGYCWATNQYFAELYDVSTKTITRWLKELQQYGYIIVILNKNESNEIVNRQISIVIDENAVLTTKKETKETKHKYGKYENVMLSDKQMETLKEEFPLDYEEWIERVSEYCAYSGKTYKDYLATIRVWSKKDNKKPIGIVYETPTYDATSTKQEYLNDDELEKILSTRGGQ